MFVFITYKYINTNTLNNIFTFIKKYIIKHIYLILICGLDKLK